MGQLSLAAEFWQSSRGLYLSLEQQLRISADFAAKGQAETIKDRAGLACVHMCSLY